MANRSIWIGWDPREVEAFDKTRRSILSRLSEPIPVHQLRLEALKDKGLFRRPMEVRGNVTWDLISNAPCATEFSISRFLVPSLSSGWSLFLDCDMLARADLVELFELADPSKAVMCVKHNYVPATMLKMDRQLQTFYARKNWSSVMLFNGDHPANQLLTVDLVNLMPGRDLHRFCWLDDEEIGELPPEWNWLVGYSDLTLDPKLVHFTDGVPLLPGYENVPFADEWRKA